MPKPRFQTGSITKYTRFWVDKSGRRHKVQTILDCVRWMRDSVRHHGVMRWGAAEPMVPRYLIETGVVERTGRYALVGMVWADNNDYRELRADLKRPLWRPVNRVKLERAYRELLVELEKTPNKVVK